MAKQRQTNRSATPVQQLLGEGLPLIQAAQRMARLERTVRGQLGALGRSVSAGGLRGSEPQAELVLLAANSAVAARLRQSLPSLLDLLQSRGWGIAGIRIKIRPEGGEPLEQPVPPKQARLGEGGLRSLAALGQSLPASPLREALETLVARHRRNGAGR